MTRAGVATALGVLATLVTSAQVGKITQQDWVTARADAQRTAWIKSDAFISAESMQKPGFDLRWKATLDNQVEAQHGSLAAGVVFGNLGFGSKPLSLVTGSANRLFAVDNDTGVVFWQRTFEATGNPAALDCPRGITGAATRPTTVVPIIPIWRGLPDRPPYSGGVGAPGEGVPADLMNRGRGARGSATTAAPAPTPAPAPPPAPPLPQVVYALSSDGHLHTLGFYAGKDVARPIPFLAANAHASDLIALNNIVYATTMRACGGVADGLWSLDLVGADNPVRGWKSEGGSPAGPPAFGSDGTVYVAIGSRSAAGDAGLSNAVVALDPKELTIRNWFTQPDAEFVAAPAAFTLGERSLVAAVARDGSIVLLDATSLGGPSHAVALSRSPATNQTGFVPGGLATWEDPAGTRWLLVPEATRISAMKVGAVNGSPALLAGWTSRAMRAPLAPVIVNGVAFVVSGSDSAPAVLYALDAATGRELWNSGNAIATSVRATALWPGIGQVHVATADDTVYAFGFAMERD